MKKITLKISAFLLLAMIVFQGHGQALDPDANGYGFYNSASPGTWKVKLLDQVGGKDLFLTVRAADLRLAYSEELPDTDPLAATQLWVFGAHPSVTGMSMMTSAFPNIGFIQIDATVTDVATPIVGTTDANLGQIQMRKSNSALPGQDQIFLRGDYAGTAWPGQSSAYRFGSAPVQDEVITLGISALNFRFKFIAPLLSNKKFDSSSIVMANPVKNQLNITGLTDNVNKVAIFSLLGQEVLSKKVDTKSSLTINVSSLSKGMYIVELSGANGKFTKKIIKE